ncbi:MFS transporter [bacterium]|nr:MFS transporter [bacterium]
MLNPTMKPLNNYLNSLVVIAALGYFVDIYDLILFSIVRVPSLQSLGLSGSELFDSGMFLLNTQMAGMLVGGLLWGILGDKRGRVSVLFGSIIMYSLANIANGFVHTVPAYAVLRFIAGIGLAGELGAGITLVAETLPKETRGWGTMIIGAVGISGDASDRDEYCAIEAIKAVGLIAEPSEPAADWKEAPL